MHRGTSLWAGVISGGLSQLEDTNALRSGQMTNKEYAAHTTRNVTVAAGVYAGIEYGAILGSAVLPGIGTIVGSVVGGLVGDKVARVVGMQAGNLVFNKPSMNPTNQLQGNHMAVQNNSFTVQNQSEAQAYQE
jgi:outer membrane lipoprotein SlyB